MSNRNFHFWLSNQDGGIAAMRPIFWVWRKSVASNRCGRAIGALSPSEKCCACAAFVWVDGEAAALLNQFAFGMIRERRAYCAVRN